MADLVTLAYSKFRFELSMIFDERVAIETKKESEDLHQKLIEFVPSGENENNYNYFPPPTYLFVSEAAP